MSMGTHIILLTSFHIKTQFSKRNYVIMKYYLKHADVDVVRASDGSYDVSLLGTTIKITKEQLPQYLSVSKPYDNVKDDIKMLARKIVDVEVMVDDDNGELLLNEAVGYAKQIIKKLT